MKTALLSIFITTILLVNSAISNADDIPFSFREIYLGNQVGEVEAIAKQQFNFTETEHLDGDITSVIAADKIGFQRKHCPIAALPNKRPNCLIARFTHRLQNSEMRLLAINVNQSFNPSISVASFMKKAKKTYGEPIFTYEGSDSPSQNSSVSETTLLWGGKKIPVAPYAPSSYMYDDFTKIGGKFITLHLYSIDNEVIGYHLRIADSEKMKQSSENSLKAFKVEEERLKQRNLESVSF